VAVSFVSGPLAGLAALDALSSEPHSRLRYLPAAQPTCFGRLGRVDEARLAYTKRCC
jgi:RNA polymerase sigma-70 factor (ECF subfamily)